MCNDSSVTTTIIVSTLSKLCILVLGTLVLGYVGVGYIGVWCELLLTV